MKIMNSRIFTAAMAFALAPLQKGCTAFTARPTPLSQCNAIRSVGALAKSRVLPSIVSSSTSSSLSNTNNSKNNNNGAVTTSIPLFNSLESAEFELQQALEHARAMDKTHGLCTEPSQKAWDAVDEIYRKMQAPSSESKSKKAIQVRVQTQSSNARMTRRVSANSKRSNSNTAVHAAGAKKAIVMGIDQTKGRQYYF